MARLIFPETFEQQRRLLGLVRTKNNNDGAASVLQGFLTEQEINLNSDFSVGNLAETYHNLAKLFARQAENLRQQRDLKWLPVFSRTRALVQYLKSFYKPNVHALGDWGLEVDDKERINYPTEFSERVKIVRAIKTKHDAYGGSASPLTVFLTQQNIDLNEDANASTQAEQMEVSRMALRRDSEQKTQQCNNLWNPVLKNLEAIGNFLMKLFVGNQKKLGEWGFTVDDSPRLPKKRKSTIKAGSKINLKGIVLGSTLTNLGTVPVHVHKGNTKKGTWVVVHINEMLGMTKGFSNIVVYNPSATENAQISTLMSK